MIVRPEDETGVEVDRRREPMGTAPEGPAPADATIASHRHPTMGLPPVDMTQGDPARAQEIRRLAHRMAGRALEVAIEIDPTFLDRYDETGMRRMMNDAQLLIERLSRSVASGDPRWLREWAEMSAPVYRRRAVPMADVMALCEGIREAYTPSLPEAERAAFDTALDQAEAVYEWHASLAGDARRRNSLLKFLYRGA